MRSGKRVWIATVVLSLASVASASTFSPTGQSETVTFTNVPSNSSVLADPNDLTGLTLNPANTLLTATLTGGFDVAQISMEGTLQTDLPIEADNWTQNADIAIFGPGYVNLSEQDFVVQAFTGYNAPNAGSFGSPEAYTGTREVGPLVVDVFNPAVATGEFSFYFWEIPSPGKDTDDNPGGTDQTWLDVSITFLGGGVTNGEFDLGPLTGGGAPDLGPGQDGEAYQFNVVEGLDFFTFSVGEVAGDDFLNIQTFETDTNDIIDTTIFLFDNNGVLVAFDDDGQHIADGILLDDDPETLEDYSDVYSQLSFANDPLPAPVANNFFGGDATSGEDGATLPAGEYTLVVGSFGTQAVDFGDPNDLGDDIVNVIGVSTIDDLIPAFDNSIAGSGTYFVQLTYGGEGAGLPGDYNNDGSVDAADFTVWRDTDGSQAGYDLWKANFGLTAATGSPVPEPGSGLLAVLAGLAAATRVRRARRLR